MQAPSQGVHLLLVEDERSIREPLAAFLKKHGYRVSLAANAAEARALLPDHAIDLALLDIMMPGEDGLSLARFIRASGDLPIIMLTAMSDDTDKIVGLEIGADDYLTKPFNPRELLARIKAILRRAGNMPPAMAEDGEAYAFADFVLKVDERRLLNAAGEDIALSTGEFRLLRELLRRPGHVLNRDQLLDLTQGREAAPFDRAIDNSVSRLRRKIERDPANPQIVKTVHGAGYVFTPAVKRL